MLNKKSFIILIMGVILLLGCSTKEGFNRGMYEGIKIRERMLRPHNDEVQPEEPKSYEQYRNERDEIK
jgi:hypothetical protein